jgi:hypothetical protein
MTANKPTPPSWYKRCGRIAAVSLIVVACLVQARPAAADPLPLGTFKIQTNNLNCATDDSNSAPYVVFLTPCQTVALNQQWTYVPVAQQILSVGRLGYCLGAYTWQNTVIYSEPCDLTKVSQRWQRHGPDSFGRYWITTEVPELAGRVCMNGEGIGLAMFPCRSTLPNDVVYLFRFPLI